MRAAALLLCVVLAGCAHALPAACPAGLAPARTADLFFGRNIGATEGVSDADWQGFVEAEIAPRFPDGFTVSDATGAWRGPDGKSVRERSKRLFVIMKDGDEAKLAAIRAAYKLRFGQDSVLAFEGAGCAGF